MVELNIIKKLIDTTEHSMESIAEILDLDINELIHADEINSRAPSKIKQLIALIAPYHE